MQKGVKEMKNWTGLMKNITMLTQFGLSFIIPTLLCLVLCWWLNTRWEWPVWIFIPGFFFGMGSSGMVAYKFFRSVVNQQKKEKKKVKVSFNRHL